MNDGEKLKITQDDVRRVFGFPDEKRRIELLDRDETTNLHDVWKGFYADGNNIWLPEVVKKMLSYKDGGTWFKHHFLILVSTTLMESHKNGHVLPYIMRCLENIHSISQWNWSEYVIRSVLRNKRACIKNSYSMFAGPALFLVLYYVDRVDISHGPYDRTIPLCNNWTTDTLKSREKQEIKEGVFGVGDVRERVNLPEAVTDCPVSKVAAEICAEERLVKSCAAQIKDRLRLYYALRDEILVLMEAAPDKERSTAEFQDAVAAARDSWIYRDEQELRGHDTGHENPSGRRYQPGDDVYASDSEYVSEPDIDADIMSEDHLSDAYHLNDNPPVRQTCPSHTLILMAVLHLCHRSLDLTVETMNRRV